MKVILINDYINYNPFLEVLSEKIWYLLFYTITHTNINKQIVQILNYKYIIIIHNLIVIYQ